MDIKNFTQFKAQSSKLKAFPFSFQLLHRASCIMLLASCLLHLDSGVLHASELQNPHSALLTPNFRWSEPVVIDSGPSNAYRTDITFDKNGNAIAVFEQKNGNVYRIFANRFVNGKGWQKPISIDTGEGNAYRAQVAFDREGNAIAVFKQEIERGKYRVFANQYIYNTGWQGPVPIDNNTGMADGQDIVFDSDGNAAAVFEEHDGNEFGIYVSFYFHTPHSALRTPSEGGWSGAFRIDNGQGNAYFPYAVFDDKGNLYVIYYKEEFGGLEVYVSRLQKPEARSQKPEVRNQKITDGSKIHKRERWDERKSEVTRGIKAVYNPVFLSELKRRIYSGNYSYTRWETPSKIDSRFRDTYRPTLLVNGNGELTALYVKWDGEYLSAYTANYINGKWDKPKEIDAGNGDVEHMRGAVNSKGEMAVVFTQWVDNEQEARGKNQEARLRIHARLYNPDLGWSEAKIIDAGKKDGYNPSVAFTESGDIIAVWCQWENVNVKSYANIYIKNTGWGRAMRLENKNGETCGVRIASCPVGKIIAIFEQEETESQRVRESESQRRINRIFAVEYISRESGVGGWESATDTYTIKKLTNESEENYYAEFSPEGTKIVFVSRQGKYSNLYIMDWDGENRKQLTFGNVIDAAPAFTPDGKKIIFTSNRIDESLPLNDSIRGWDIWSINTDGTALTRITKAQTNELAPRPTPDGKNILFISTAGGDHAIWNMDINGENQRRLTSGGTGDWFPAMNPDGREVVFVSTRLGNGDIWTIDSVEKKYNRLTYTDLPEFSPAWSPDGSKIAYVTNKGGEFDIWIMDRDGKNKIRLTKGISGGNWGSRFSAKKILETAGYYHLSWHPDGTKILFTEWGNDTTSHISIIEFDKEILDKLEVDNTTVAEYTLIGEKELTAGDWEDFAPSFNPDGISLVFSSNRSGNWDIWSMEFNGKNLRRLTDEENDDFAPVFSPDGNYIAFLKGSKLKAQSSKELLSAFNFQLSTYDIWIMKSDGSGIKQITKDVQVISFPTWNPEGNEIAFVAKGDKDVEIWTYNLKSKIQNSRFKIQNLQDDLQFRSTNPVERLHNSQHYPFEGFLYRIGYNPAGDKITFESNISGNVEIWTMRTDGTNFACITKGDSPHWNPVWSPDGKMIAYTTDKLGEEAGLHNWRNYNIWVANPEVQKEMLITGEEQIDWNPVWSPDGKKIVYVTNRSGDFKHFSLWVLYLK